MHPFWHKLDMLPKVNHNNASQDDISSEELDLFKQVYAQAGQLSIVQLLRKLRALINPECTHVKEPEMKSTMQGRPHGKMDKSIQHEPSVFERVPLVQDNYSLTDSGLVNVDPLRSIRPTKRRKAKEKVIIYILNMTY